MEIDNYGVITVIVPIYKVEDYLDECIDSIVNQTYKHLQIILVDDGSPDRSGKIADEWAQKDNRILVIHKKNGGLSDARNAGIKCATGEYIAFVDSDDWIEHDMYEKMLQTLLKKDADIVACGILRSFPHRDEPFDVECLEGNSSKILKLIYEDTKYPVAAWNKLYKRFLWDNFEFPVGKICEDAFTTYLLVDKAEKIVQIAEALYHYRIREQSIMTTAFTKTRMDEEEAWRVNYLYMQKKYPEIGKSAFDFYLQKVNVLIHTINLEESPQYKNEFMYLYNILKSNLWYVLFKSKLNFKYRLWFLKEILRIKGK